MRAEPSSRSLISSSLFWQSLRSASASANFILPPFQNFPAGLGDEAHTGKPEETMRWETLLAVLRHHPSQDRRRAEPQEKRHQFMKDEQLGAQYREAEGHRRRPPPVHSNRTADQKQRETIDEHQKQISGLHFHLHRWFPISSTCLLP